MSIQHNLKLKYRDIKPNKSPCPRMLYYAINRVIRMMKNHIHQQYHTDPQRLKNEMIALQIIHKKVIQFVSVCKYYKGK